MKRKVKKCIGFGEYEGKCSSTEFHPQSPWWCKRCEELRRKHIDGQLTSILDDMEKGK